MRFSTRLTTSLNISFDGVYDAEFAKKFVNTLNFHLELLLIVLPSTSTNSKSNKNFTNALTKFSFEFSYTVFKDSAINCVDSVVIFLRSDQG